MIYPTMYQGGATTMVGYHYHSSPTMVSGTTMAGYHYHSGPTMAGYHSSPTIVYSSLHLAIARYREVCRLA